MSTKAERELENIERHIAQLEAAAGDNQEARQRLSALHQQVERLRHQIHSKLEAWKKTELARHPQLACRLGRFGYFGLARGLGLCRGLGF